MAHNSSEEVHAVDFLEPNLEGAGLRIAIVQGRFNESIGNALSTSCIAELIRLGVTNDDILLTTVPGNSG